VAIADQNPVTIGAYHTADGPYWFGSFDAFNLFRETRAWTAADRQLSDLMLKALVDFARTGSPASADVTWRGRRKTSVCSCLTFPLGLKSCMLIE
jgi:para-nitrobenzyl esterase